MSEEAEIQSQQQELANHPLTTSDMVAQLYSLRQTKAALEKAEKELLAQLKPLTDPDFDALSLKETAKLNLDIYEFARVPGTSRTIKAEKLLERGVSPDIVDYATSTTTYFRYSVKMLKEDDGC